MGRIWDFLNQDSNEALDRLLRPYAFFAMRHRLLMFLVNVALLAAVWIFVSPTLVLLVLALGIAFVVTMTLISRWRRRRDSSPEEH